MIDKRETKIFWPIVKIYSFFIRLLSQKVVTKQDIALSSFLIEDYLKVFESYYGAENLTFNLNCYQHYPMQVLRAGQLNKIHAFGFEGIFLIVQDFILEQEIFVFKPLIILF